MLQSFPIENAFKIVLRKKFTWPGICMHGCNICPQLIMEGKEAET